MAWDCITRISDAIFTCVGFVNWLCRGLVPKKLPLNVNYCSHRCVQCPVDDGTHANISDIANLQHSAAACCIVERPVTPEFVTDVWFSRLINTPQSDIILLNRGVHHPVFGHASPHRMIALDGHGCRAQSSVALHVITFADLDRGPLCLCACRYRLMVAQCMRSWRRTWLAATPAMLLKRAGKLSISGSLGPEYVAW